VVGGVGGVREGEPFIVFFIRQFQFALLFFFVITITGSSSSSSAVCSIAVLQSARE